MQYCNQEGEEPAIHRDWDTYEKESAKQPGKYERADHWDMAIVLDHPSLAANEEGLGTCWVTELDEREIHHILSISDEVRAPLMMTLGYPTEWPDPTPKKLLSELVCYEEYV